MSDVDLRPGFSAVRDQGRRGTCVAFAVTAGHEHTRYSDKALVEDLSEEALYYQCKQIDGDTTSGTSFDSAAQALDKVGQPFAEKWLYDKRTDDTAADYLPPPEAIDPLSCYKADLMTIPLKIDEIVNCLEKSYFVVIWPLSVLLVSECNRRKSSLTILLRYPGRVPRRFVSRLRNRFSADKRVHFSQLLG